MVRPLSPDWTLSLAMMLPSGPPLTVEERKRTQVCLEFMESLRWDSREAISPFDENSGDTQLIIERHPWAIRGATLLRLETLGWTPFQIASAVLTHRDFNACNMYHWYKCCTHMAARLEGAAAFAQRAINAYEDACRARGLPRRCTNCEVTHQRCSLRDNLKSKPPCRSCKSHGIQDERCIQKYNPYPPTEQNSILEFPPLGFLYHEGREPLSNLRLRRKRSGEAVVEASRTPHASSDDAGNRPSHGEDVPRDNRSDDLEIRDSRATVGGEEHLADTVERQDDFHKKRRISEKGEFIYTSPKLKTPTQPNIPEEAGGCPSNSRHQDATRAETSHAGLEHANTGHTETEQVDTGHADTGHTGYSPDDDLADSSSAEQRFVDSHFHNFSSANLDPSADDEGAGSEQPNITPSDTANPEGASPMLHETGFEVPHIAPLAVVNPDPHERTDSEGAGVGYSSTQYPSNGPPHTGATNNGLVNYGPVDDGPANHGSATINAAENNATNIDDDDDSDWGRSSEDMENWFSWNEFTYMNRSEMFENMTEDQVNQVLVHGLDNDWTPDWF